MTTLSSPSPTADARRSGPVAPEVRADAGVLLFANPFSGSGPNRQWVESFAAELQHAGLVPTVVWDATQRRATLARLAAEFDAKPDARKEPPWVVAAGGDGSVAAVLNDMAAVGVTHWPFATLPVGNENLFARHFGIDRRKPHRLIDALVRGWTRPVDLGRIDRAEASPVRFTLMCSAGYDADVVHRLAAWRSRTAPNNPPGQLRRVSLKNYLPRMVGALRQYTCPSVTLTPADGTHAGQAIAGCHAFIFNLPEYGKDLGLCRHARADDGKLDFVLFTRPGRVRLLNYLRAAAMNARHLRRADVIHGQASAFTFSTSADLPIPLQADGDPAGHVTADHPVTITAEPAALRVVHTTA